MKLFIAIALFVAAVVASPVPKDPSGDATILRYSSDNIGVDGYNFAYETSNGIAAEESGALKNVGTENEAIEVRGVVSYPAPDGNIITLTYVANELGFQPQGAHLPQAP